MQSCCQRCNPARKSLIDDYRGREVSGCFPSRRGRFLSSSVGVAVVGAIAVVPGVASVLKLTQVPAGPRAKLAGPLVAHVRDLKSGEISLLVGTSHVIHRDRDLAARLYAAAQQTQVR